MRQNPQHRRTCSLALASTSAFALLFLTTFSASADLYLVQKEHNSQKFGEKDAQVSDTLIRTCVAEGKLRQDYGDPPASIHITRLDRRPGELISYLINLGTGPFGNTYWTFCHPLAQSPPQTASNDQNNGIAAEKDAKPTGPAGSREAIAVTDTGETKLINTFRCKKYLLKDSSGSVEFSSEIWVTTDILPALEQYGLAWGVRIERSDSKLSFREDSSGTPEEMRTIKGFPVLITEIEHNQYVHRERTLELLELKESPLPPNQFDLPKGLKKKYRGAMAHPPECED